MSEQKKCPKCGKFKARMTAETEEGGSTLQGGSHIPKIVMKHFTCDGCGWKWGE